MVSVIRLNDGSQVLTPTIARVASLPVGVLTDLSFGRTFTGINEVLDCRDAVMAESEALSDELFQVIGSGSTDGVKPKLVGLRRAIHNAKPPKAGEWNDAIAASLPPALARRVRDWNARLRELHTLRNELPGILDSERRQKETIVRTTAANAMFDRAILHSSKDLHNQLKKWLEGEQSRPPQSSIVKLTRYISRATTRTSPHSTYTLIGLATWVGDGPSIQLATPLSSIACVTECNGALTQQIISSLYKELQGPDALVPRLNPSALTSPRVLEFIGPSLKEPVVKVSRVAMIEALLATLDESCGLTIWELVACLDDSASNHRETLLKLFKIGLLEWRLPIDDLSSRPIGDLAAWLGSCTCEATEGLHRLTSQLDAELARAIPLDNTGSQEARRGRLRDSLTELSTRAGLSADLSRANDRDMFFENGVLTEPAVQCSTSSWRPVLESLADSRRLLGVFDPNLPARLALADLFVGRLGRGARVPLLTFHRTVAEELSRGGDEQSEPASEISRILGISSLSEGQLASSPLPRFRELANIQKTTLASFLSSGDSGVLRMNTVAGALAGEWPTWLTSPESVCFYLQVYHRRQGDPHVVANAAHGGYGRGRSRATHLIERAGGSSYGLGETTVSRADSVLAELSGMFGFSPNVRQRMTEFEIDYPFTSSTRPQEERLPINALMVEHDASADLLRLVERDSGSTVTPLHLGMMADTLLPPLARLMMQAFGSTYYLHPLQPFPVSVDNFAATNRVIIYEPRLELGRVALRRARWIIPAALVPQRGQGQSDAEYFTEIVSWIRRSGLPRQCFARTWPAAVLSSIRRSADELLNKSYKPFYVDFSNWYTVQDFERLTWDRRGTVMFEELLPGLDDAPGTQRDRAHVTEVMVEVSDASTKYE